MCSLESVVFLEKIECSIGMPPKKNNSSKGGAGSEISKKGSVGKKENKGGVAIKVRHILCKKQVFF